jgi:hypothetical protein
MRRGRLGELIGDFGGAAMGWTAPCGRDRTLQLPSERNSVSTRTRRAFAARTRQDRRREVAATGTPSMRAPLVARCQCPQASQMCQPRGNAGESGIFVAIAPSSASCMVHHQRAQVAAPGRSGRGWRVPSAIASLVRAPCRTGRDSGRTDPAMGAPVIAIARGIP